MDNKEKLKNINKDNPTIIKKIIFNRSATDKNIIPDYEESLLKFDHTRWILDLARPQRDLDSYSNIFLKDEYKLIGYLFPDPSGSRGYVYALAKDIKPSLPKECQVEDDMFLQAPRRPELDKALSSFMMAIDGDRSPLSYVQAAVLYHDLCEYGSTSHSISWGRDIILPFYPFDSEMNNYEWDMLHEEPESINPQFYYENGRPTVVFYTINDVVTVELIEYKHVFDKNDYSIQVIKRCIAKAGSGIIF